MTRLKFGFGLSYCVDVVDAGEFEDCRKSRMGKQELPWSACHTIRGDFFEILFDSVLMNTRKANY